MEERVRMMSQTRPHDAELALKVKIIRVLGEGGFSFVYLAQDETSGVRQPYLSMLCSNVLMYTLASIRIEENPLSEWSGGCPPSDAGGRGV